MRAIMWTLTTIFALAGLALRADHGAWFGSPPAWLVDYGVKGFFFLAIISCPFLWARSYGVMPSGLLIPGKQRFMMALALILAIPLVLPWY